jgi:ribose-phosphate pyrophosphokinase
MEPIFFALSDDGAFAHRLAGLVDASLGEMSVRRFPDGESWVRVLEDVEGREVVVVANLDRPDQKLSQLMFLAETLRDLGAARVGVVAPYLAYMRQDERFAPGEGVTSRYFADFLSRYFDWLVTLDPHLHRHGSLADLYRIPTFSGRAAPQIAQWLTRQAIDPVLIGPDAESEQWVGAVAHIMGCPQVIFDKIRHGDREVELADVTRGKVDLCSVRNRTPVIIDDIISTGATMFEAVDQLQTAGLRAPICVGIHGVFSDDADRQLLARGAEQVVTCNSIAHPTNAIDITPALAEQIGAALSHTSVDSAEWALVSEH